MYVYDNSLSKEQNEANEAEFYRIINLPKEQKEAELRAAKNREENSRVALTRATVLIILSFMFFRVSHKAPEGFKGIRIITIPMGAFLLLSGLLLAALHDR